MLKGIKKGWHIEKADKGRICESWSICKGKDWQKDKFSAYECLESFNTPPPSNACEVINHGAVQVKSLKLVPKVGSYHPQSSLCTCLSCRKVNWSSPSSYKKINGKAAASCNLGPDILGRHSSWEQGSISPRLVQSRKTFMSPQARLREQPHTRVRAGGRDGML